MSRKEYRYLVERRWSFQNDIEWWGDFHGTIRAGLILEQARIDAKIANYDANELANRVYITREQFMEYLDIPEVDNAEFDESQIGDNDLWCHVCGKFSDSENLDHVWYKYPKGEDSFCCINVCPHCSGWNTVQDVGP